MRRRMFNWMKTNPHRHYGLPIMMFAFGISIPLMWLVDDDSLLGKIIGRVDALLLFTGLVLLLCHYTGRLCEQCIREMPENAPAEAENKRHWLRKYHQRGRYWLGLLCLVGASFGAKAWQGDFDTVLGHGITTAVNLWIMYDLWAERTHGRFRPWCPWCRRGGGGDGEDAETPTPTVPQTV